MRLEWDKIGEHFYETGTDRGVIYPMSRLGTSYMDGAAWSGLTAVTERPSGGESNPIWADNIKYANLLSAEQYGITIEAYTYPDEFEECDGHVTLAPGITIGQQKRRGFGFSWRTLIGNETVQDDLGYKIHIVYGCTSAPSEKNYQTKNESPEAMTMSWEIDTVPVEVENHRPVSQVTIDSRLISAADLKKIEDKLYGTATTPPRIILPDEILSLVNGGGTQDDNGLVITDP